ncbi:hypothetical protein RFI_07798 [Reticulomyxa filosa]|uniref:Uncharacterized protein n=1 Tax=Reticulomyxa filosa TaxID=46433 RepID=X6NVL7_RETFI|nr:hypothetical protein RFI_07798 [Reticulomyxa filosa]|eukprot:ETO29327.1 hypothetical protein RFI_07798 [Reticulomyxa filosa]
MEPQVPTNNNEMQCIGTNIHPMIKKLMNQKNFQLVDDLQISGYRTWITKQVQISQKKTSKNVTQGPLPSLDLSHTWTDCTCGEEEEIFDKINQADVLPSSSRQMTMDQEASIEHYASDDFSWWCGIHYDNNCPRMLLVGIDSKIYLVDESFNFFFNATFSQMLANILCFDNDFNTKSQSDRVTIMDGTLMFALDASDISNEKPMVFKILDCLVWKSKRLKTLQDRIEKQISLHFFS